MRDVFNLHPTLLQVLNHIHGNRSEVQVQEIARQADPKTVQAGETLYKRGDKARNIPACVACHGPGGRGNLAAGYPALRAQQSVYVVKQLNDYASGARYSGAKNPAAPSRNGAMMLTIAKRLTPEDIAAVASYVQGLR